jgi:hypothetical protein
VIRLRVCAIWRGRGVISRRAGAGGVVVPFRVLVVGGPLAAPPAPHVFLRRDWHAGRLLLD